MVIDMCNIRLENELKEEHSRKFDMYIRYIETKQMERIKWKNEKNLKRLVSYRYGSCPKHSVTNLSSYKLEEKELNRREQSAAIFRYIDNKR